MKQKKKEANSDNTQKQIINKTTQLSNSFPQSKSLRLQFILL